MRQAQLEDFWTDNPDELPQNPTDEIWWNAWCDPEYVDRLDEVVTKLGGRLANSDYRLYFPETTVVPIFCSRSIIELILFAACGVLELRRGTDTPNFFIDDIRHQQKEWTEDLASRITWPDTKTPAVCLLDTGVNRAHYLIEPALSTSDNYAYNEEWGSDDHYEPDGHGTPMAGLILHGDLIGPLSDKRELKLEHRLESVKILPPNGFPPNDPGSYGVITQAAISKPIESDRNRVFCLAITNKTVSGEIPSTWSAAIDQAAIGKMIGDEENAPKRLFLISAGNIPPEIDVSRIKEADYYPIEDPAQAWNAITVGGYTDKVEIDDPDLNGWSPFSQVGSLSPFSRTSANWKHNKAPIKPEIVMEAGNRAISPSKTEVLSLSSMALLSTGKNVDNLPLVPFDATSAATAQAARLSARLMSSFPNLWPETIRALIVHSAEWTRPMIDAFKETTSKRDNYKIVRRFGYGVPSYERAVASAKNHLAMVQQTTIQPYRVEGSRKFNECHYYNLPWPKTSIEQLENKTIKLKITLSYFIEPNPGFSAFIDPQRYQSFGLRFDLKRKNETPTEFKKRVNKFEREKSEIVNSQSDDGRWYLGPDAVSSGSLHCDVWEGPAIELLNRDILCISPIGGWWRNRASKEICEQKARYSLVITMQTDDTDIDLHTEISSIINTPTEITV